MSCTIKWTNFLSKWYSNGINIPFPLPVGRDYQTERVLRVTLLVVSNSHAKERQKRFSHMINTEWFSFGGKKWTSHHLPYLKRNRRLFFFLHQPPIWPYQTIRLTIETEVKCWHKFESWYHREGWIKIENKVRLSMQHWGTPALTQMDPLEWPFKITFISRIEIWKFFHPFVIWFITLLVRLHFFLSLANEWF